MIDLHILIIIKSNLSCIIYSFYIETRLVNYFTRQIVDGVREKSSILLPKPIPPDELEESEDASPIPNLEPGLDLSSKALPIKDTIHFEDSAIERAFVYHHDYLRDATGDPTSTVKVVLKTIVEALLGEVERCVYVVILLSLLSRVFILVH